MGLLDGKRILITGVLTDATATDHEETYRLAGKKIYKLLGQHYKVLDGFFTTCGCEPGTPDWAISANNMDLHMGEDMHDSFVEYQTRLLDEFEKMREPYGFQIIEANGPIEEVFEEIRRRIAPLLHS